jgi:hypothetical protein
VIGDRKVVIVDREVVIGNRDDTAGNREPIPNTLPTEENPNAQNGLYS